MTFPSEDSYRFDEFELSRTRRILLRNGESITLLPKTFEVLSCLVSNPGRVLAKDEILKSVWPGSYVEENNLTQHISLLRKALTDRSRFIVTIPGRGYQFTANVAVETIPIDDAPVVSSNGHALHAANGHSQQSASNLAAMTPALVPEPAVETPSAQPVAAPTRFQLPRRIFQLRLQCIAIAGTLLALIAAAGFATWQHWRTPPQFHSVLVADFTNATGDATFDRTLKHALEIDLGQASYIDVMSEREALNTLALMGRSPETSQNSPITPELAREICVHSNRQVLLTGSIFPVGREYLLTVEATDCNSGHLLTAAKAEAAAKEKVLSALDDIADHIRRGLGGAHKPTQS